MTHESRIETQRQRGPNLTLNFLSCIIKKYTPWKASLVLLLKEVKVPPDPKITIKLLTFNNLSLLMGNHSNTSRPSRLALPGSFLTPVKTVEGSK